jgi:hypothetical protein
LTEDNGAPVEFLQIDKTQAEDAYPIDEANAPDAK